MARTSLTRTERGVRATDLTPAQLRSLMDAEARGDPRGMFEVRSWLAKATSPYQFEPCLRCRHHEHWKAIRDAGLPPGCQCEAGHMIDDWDVWMFLAGRGTGKTYTGSSWAVEQALRFPGSFGAVIAPTHKDLRNTVVEGPTGLIRAIPRDLVQLTRDTNVWNQSAGEIKLKNGSVIRTLAAEKPDRIRGANLTWVWADEMAAWTRLDYAWEQLEMATRIGAPKFLVTTTPRPLPLLKYLLASDRTQVTRASSYDNPHLSKRFLETMRRRYEGTRVGKQELHGELLDDIEGALWSWAMMEDARLPTESLPGHMERIVVAVDPSGGGAAEIGIVVVGLREDTCYVLADWTMRGSPREWAARAVEAYELFAADRIIGERNYGGDMVEATIRSVAPHVPYSDVTASRGKQLRAEPVVALYEQGKVRHPVDLPELEQQLTGWVPNTGMASPDRLDALVWAVTELMLADLKSPAYDLAALLAATPTGDQRKAPWRI